MRLSLPIRAAPLFVTLVLLISPTLAQTRDGILTIYHRDNPPSASIHEEATNSTVVPFMPLFNNLVLYDQQIAQNSSQSIVPDLAKSWHWNAEMTELTFKLQEGVKWHDGQVSADELFGTDNVPRPFSDTLQLIKSVF